VNVVISLNICRPQGVERRASRPTP
jgi:hypothetical protein